ncbi:hypothetical protein ZTR_09136 [Talaromyces verruculosus]|nr:hypothetical protein ZTR_09136 [Talaromyces verruculosus]
MDADIIIVGGGTAGLVLANRLTENEKIRVLVLEVGSDRLNDPRIMVPGLAPATYEDYDFDWNFISAPQEQLNGRQLLATKGRTLGGFSAINTGMIVWPSKIDLKAWAKLAPSDKVRQFFNGMQFDGKDQGTDAPFDALKNLGYPQKGDPINGQGTGPFVTPGAIDPVTHTRSHAGAEYLTEAVKQRPKLRILTGVLVEKIVFKQEGDGPAIATAVQDPTRREIIEVRINKEIILAAGAAQTPQILELSGIGDVRLLNKHGIDAVGET